METWNPAGHTLEIPSVDGEAYSREMQIFRGRYTIKTPPLHPQGKNPPGVV
jgi:hypothetical protein